MALVAPAAAFAIYCRYRNRPLYDFAKPVPLVLLLAVYLANRSGTGLYFLFVSALLSGMIGDILLLRERTFRYGAVFFSLGHILYAAAFYIIGGGPWLSVLLLVFGYTAIYCAFVYRRLEMTGGMGNVWMGLPYLILVSLLLVFASSTAGRIGVLGVPQSLWFLPPAVAEVSVFAGAVLFYISDLVLVWNRYAGSFERAQLIILTTYYSAQLLITIGGVSYLT